MSEISIRVERDVVIVTGPNFELRIEPPAGTSAELIAADLSGCDVQVWKTLPTPPVAYPHAL